MKTKTIINFSMLFVLVLTFMSISAMAQAGVGRGVNEIPYSETITACNGEDVDLEGFLKLNSVQVNTDGEFGANLNVHGMNKIYAEGIGQDTGTQYVYNFSASFGESVDITDDSPWVITQVAKGRLVGQGNVPDTTIEFIMIWRINANGEWAFFGIRDRVYCTS